MITYQVAKTSSDIETALNLVNEVYTSEGYVKKQVPKENYSITDTLKEKRSSTLLAYQDRILCGTVSIVRSQGGKLPMDTIFKSELDIVRVQHPRLAEICQFAVKKDFSALDTSLELLSHAIYILNTEQQHYVCFTVNPKHKKFYSSLGAMQLGSEKSYPMVNNAPALALFLDLSTPKTSSIFLDKIKSTVPSEDFITSYRKSLIIE